MNHEARPNDKLLENDKDYQEWKACNETITKLDNILIDLRRYGFTVATGLAAGGSILGLQPFTAFQPFQIMIIFATMALIDVLYWLDVYYQTILSAVILRTQVLERNLSLGVDTYISRFYMRHGIGKALHLLYIGFLVSLAILGVYVVYLNPLDSLSTIPFLIWILFLCIPIGFVFCIWFFFDRARYTTYKKAQAKISNFLRNPKKQVTEHGRTIDQEIMEFLDSDKEDLGLDLESNEWVFYDKKEKYQWFSSERRLIVTSKRIYAVKSSLLRHSVAFLEYHKVKCVKGELRGNDIWYEITEKGSDEYLFDIEISAEDCEEIDDRIIKQKMIKNKEIEDLKSGEQTWGE